MTKKIRTYTELIQLNSFAERLEYLKLNSSVGVETFGSGRYVNQNFYRRNPYWKAARREVILRDQGLDLGVEGLEINCGIYIHHMNPITMDDLLEQSEFLLDPEYLICCSHKTHNAIHYGFSYDGGMLVARSPNDTCPWR